MGARTYDIGYFSSSDRGLECLLDMIPKMEEKLGRPVKSVWAYGWNTFDQVHSKNPEMMKWKWQIIRKMNNVGMVNKNRLSHEDLAKLMKDTKVWTYPTEFTEIHCITALKAVEAGCYPITTGVAALSETVTSGTTIKCNDIYTSIEKQNEFIDATIVAINSNVINIPKVANRYWHNVANVWSKAL